jgi:hypothetical protein
MLKKQAYSKRKQAKRDSLENSVESRTKSLKKFQQKKDALMLDSQRKRANVSALNKSPHRKALKNDKFSSSKKVENVQRVDSVEMMQTPND